MPTDAQIHLPATTTPQSLYTDYMNDEAFPENLKCSKTYFDEIFESEYGEKVKWTNETHIGKCFACIRHEKYGQLVTICG